MFREMQGQTLEGDADVKGRGEVEAMLEIDRAAEPAAIELPGFGFVENAQDGNGLQDFNHERS